MASGICHPTATQKKTPQKTPLPMASPPAATNPVEKSREPLALTQNAAARCASQADGKASKRTRTAKRSKGLRFNAWRRSDNHRAKPPAVDRKSTRLNSSHGYISYAVFCLKKKKNQ